jgi:hypothetical protein
MSGSLVQIISNQSNAILFKNSTITYFKLAFHKYINFAIEQHTHQFYIKPDLSNELNTIRINKYGDYLNKLILKLKIKAESTNLGNFSFIYNLGLSIIKNIQLKIGNTIIDEIYGNWLIIWKELFNENNIKNILNKLVGNTIENLDYNNKTKICDLYIPIPFFYDNNLSLPLISLVHDDIELLFKFRKNDELIIKQDNTFEDIKFRDFLYTLASDNIVDFESSYQSTYSVSHGSQDSAYASKYNSVYELFNPEISAYDSAIKTYNDDEFIMLDDIVQIGNYPTDFFGDNEQCIDNISIDDAKNICKSLDNNYNAFFAYNKTGIGRICFKNIYNLNNHNNLSINRQTDINDINTAFFIIKNKKTYDVNLEIIASESYLITENIILELAKKNRLLHLKDTLLIDSHYYQEEIIPFNTPKGLYTINSKFPTKFLSFVIQPGGLINGEKYLHIPGDNYFLNAGIRFCYRYAKSIIGNFIEDDILDSVNNLEYDIFFHFIEAYHIKIGEKLVFNEINNNIYVNIFANLFNKLNPILISKAITYNTILDIAIFNSNKIKININNLNKQDKFILSLSCEELDKLYTPTTDIFNEGHPNYDYNIHDFSTYTTQLDRQNFNFFSEISLELNNIPKTNSNDIILYNSLENIKYDMSIKNGINFYSFSLYPKKYNPSGTCNFSVIDKYSFIFKIKTNDNDIDTLLFNLEEKIIKKNSKILFMSKYYNIITIEDNMLTLKYV